MSVVTRRRVIGAITLTAVLGGLALVGVGLWSTLAPTSHGAAVSHERRAVPRAAVELPPAAAPTELTIPVIGFTAPIAELPGEATGTITPPSVDEAFWLSSYGSPGADSANTVYLVGHTSADGHAVLDPLVDRESQRSTLLPGDELLLTTAEGTVVYEVFSVERHERQRLDEISSVWENSPGRLVLITCFFEQQGDEVSDNLVVFARVRDAE